MKVDSSCAILSDAVKTSDTIRIYTFYYVLCAADEIKIMSSPLLFFSYMNVFQSLVFFSYLEYALPPHTLKLMLHGSFYDFICRVINSRPFHGTNCYESLTGLVIYFLLFPY